MKIFVSHSSRQKLFVRELRRRLPSPVDLWIDEREIGMGEDIDQRIRSGIHEECDLFLVIVDDFATESPWVQREIRLARERERHLDRTFLLPIVLSNEAWESLEFPDMENRKYLSCPDFSEGSINSVATGLVEELFRWLDRERSHDNRAATTTLADAEDLSRHLAKEIRAIVHPHRRKNPLPLSDLAEYLGRDEAIGPIHTDDIYPTIKRLRNQGFLDGIYCDEEVIYLATERYSYKEGIHEKAKGLIGREAARRVQPGERVAIDAGSTTLQLAVRLAHEVRSRALTGLEIFTNSIPVAFQFLDTLNRIEAGDEDGICRVTLLGGWCRPVSLSVVPEVTPEGRDSLIQLPDTLDVCFLGTNGLCDQTQMGLTHSIEVPAKRAFLSRAKSKIILADASKFGIQQPIPFAGLEEELEIISAEVTGFETELEKFSKTVRKSPSTITICQ